MKLLKTELVFENSSSFYKAALLYLSKPQAINKKICSCQVNRIVELNKNTTLQITLQKLKSIPVDKDINWNNFKMIDFERANKPFHYCILTTITPKNVSKHKFNVVTLLENSSCTFNRNKDEEKGLLPEFCYKISYSSNNLLCLWISDDYTTYENFEKSTTWLKEVFFNKFIKWMQCAKDFNNTQSIESLQLVDMDIYNQKYAELKAKYASDLVKIWTECTNPQKYIYEDIGIATYLLILWEKEREEKQLHSLQTFVDIGCGNGLLTFLLTNEGHLGFGIDLRRRKIWSHYPDTVKLREETITPSTMLLFPKSDWIIGNHSDELSAWIPIISARSSYYSRFFVLPCCAFELSGQKFRRRTTLLSVYEDFIEYLKEISTICGFDYKVDRLKIPSTKRIAIIGTYNRTYNVENFEIYSKKIQHFIESLADDFKPREAVEKIKNCTTINKKVEETIIKLVFQKLIEKKRFSPEFPHWNVGELVSLNDAIEFIPDHLKMHLKSENGGLKTLLKNNSSIFEVTQGIVQLKTPVSLSVKLRYQNNRNFKFQRKPCFFLSNHPDGCPFTKSECTYYHDTD